MTSRSLPELSAPTSLANFHGQPTAPTANGENSPSSPEFRTGTPSSQGSARAQNRGARSFAFDYAGHARFHDRRHRGNGPRRQRARFQREVRGDDGRDARTVKHRGRQRTAEE